MIHKRNLFSNTTCMPQAVLNLKLFDMNSPFGTLAIPSGWRYSIRIIRLMP
jgi:hypothetical protein